MTQESSSSVRIAQDVRFIIVVYRGAIGFQFFFFIQVAYCRYAAHLA